MRAGFIVTGILSIGTIAVFGLAALAATMFPQGTTVAAMWNGGFNSGIGIAKSGPIMVTGPAPVVINDSGGGSSGVTPVAPATPVAPPDASGLPVTPSDAPPAK